MQVRLVLSGKGLEIYRPNGGRFLTMVELEERARLAEEPAQVAEELLAQYRDRFGDLG